MCIFVILEICSQYLWFLISGFFLLSNSYNIFAFYIWVFKTIAWGVLWECSNECKVCFLTNWGSGFKEIWLNFLCPSDWNNLIQVNPPTYLLLYIFCVFVSVGTHVSTVSLSRSEYCENQAFSFHHVGPGMDWTLVIGQQTFFFFFFFKPVRK